ncbi:signal peptidase I [Halobacillus campisalis]|uniref:Signal peptidase I n=1 Tax=Halobacillus campisalis TaxID=435909 RepID=A0ABW2K106_9BACI|nr:signal peptidase I [Halobacillus campisalis]
MKKQWLEWVKALAIAALLAIVIRVFLFAPVIVEGPSMSPNLHDGDHLIVSKINYSLGEPDRFDVTVFHASDQQDFIKRVIGLPGDEVAMQGDELYINGEVVEEPYLEDSKEEAAEGELVTEDFTIDELPGGHSEVPEDHVLVLGDNRDNSTDSRAIGMVSYDQLVGVGLFTYWPFNRIGLVN